MAEYLAPGVYVEEVERGAVPLAGVSTSTAGFLGPTERGPTTPRLLTSFADYRRTYGDHLSVDDSYLAHAVEGFFANGGNRCFLGRIAAEEDAAAVVALPLERPSTDRLDPLVSADADRLDFGEVAESDDLTLTIELRHVGDPDEHDDIDIVLATAAAIETTLTDSGFSLAWADGTPDTDPQPLVPDADESTELHVTFAPESDVWRHWAQLTIDPGDGIEPVRVTLAGVNADETGDDLLDATDDRLAFPLLEDGETETLPVTLVHGGGDEIEIDPAESVIIGPDAGAFSIDESDTISVDADDPEAEFSIEFDPDDPVGPKHGILLVAHDGDNAPLVIQLSGSLGGAMTVDAVGPGSWGNHVAVLIEDASMYQAGTNELFKLTIRYWRDEDDAELARAGDADPDDEDVPDPDVEEVFDNLSPREASSNFYITTIEGSSMLIEPTQTATGRPATDTGPVWLSGGADNDIERSDYEGDATDPPEERTGFAGFEPIDEIALVCVPDEHAHNVTDLLVDHCEDLDDRFAILQAARNPGQVGDLRPPVDSDMAGFYYPWVEVIDPQTGSTVTVPPGGHVAGVVARTDTRRGVHKAPANEIVQGIQGLQRPITTGEQEILNPRGVNCIRSFRGRGIRVWGARTATSNPNWKYINVRRLFLFLRGSIEEGTQWVVFEPNNEQLWSRVEQTIRNFLTDVWQDGALMGTTPEEAFFVTCDRTTMTQSDIEQGRLICEIGVAPTRPAEFVVFRISQWTANAD